MYGDVMKKYIFIDIDGTLFDPVNHCVPESAKTALQLAKENGHELFICTGRPKPVVESSYLDLPVSGIIYAGGGHIVINHQTIYTALFPKDVLLKILDDFQKQQISYTLEGIERNYYTEWTMQYFRNYFCKKASAESEMKDKFEHFIDIKPIHLLIEEDLQQVSKIDLFAKNDERIHEYIKNLPECVEGFVYSVPIGDVIEAEILVSGVSKASGIDRVLKYYGAKLEDSIAIGDSTNDLAMIEHAHIGVAMGNACDEIKEKAAFVTKRVDEDGLYHAFKELKLI